MARLGVLAMRQPSTAEVTTVASGLRIGFHYPAQLMPLLVVFQELLDAELAMLPGLLGPGRVAIDVGASIGTWTLCAARTGAEVHACEPDSENRKVLEENLRRNCVASNVFVHDTALGAAEGWRLTSRDERRYLIKVTLATDASNGDGKRISSFDGFVDRQRLTHVDVMKVNTAGCEADVLAGCQQMFRAGRIGVAMFLDGVAVRPGLAGLRQHSYELGFFNSRRRKFVPVNDLSLMDAARPGPLNRYVIVKHPSVQL